MSRDQEPSEDETLTRIGPSALRLAPPESWERAFAARCQGAASLRCYNQHGRGQGYRVIEADLEALEGEPPRWSATGIIGDEDARELATEPLTRSQLLALCVQAGLDEAGDHKVGKDNSLTPKDVVIRVVVEDARGDVLINVSRRYDLVRGASESEGDGSGPPIEIVDQEPERATGYIPAGPLVDRLLVQHEDLIKHALNRPAAAASDPAIVAQQLELARRAGFSEGYLACMTKMERIVGRGRASDDDDDDDGEEVVMSPHRQKLLETMPAVARELGSSMKDVGVYAVDKLEKIFTE